MANNYFQFKKFTVHQDRCAMKVTTDSCIFGAWVAKSVPSGKASTVLDIGTGTGLLSLMLHQEYPCKIEAIEIDAAAAGQAKENVEAAQADNDITITTGDILEMPPRPFDVVISNPPFYENELSSGKAAKDAAHHGTALTLTTLIDTLPNWLKDDGKFYLLLPEKRCGMAVELLEAAGLFVDELMKVRNSVNHPPMRSLLKGSKIKTKYPVESVFTIRNEAGDYTDEFKSLLKPFYLHL